MVLLFLRARRLLSLPAVHSAHSFLPLRVGGFYNPEELSMNSERDFPSESISKVKNCRPYIDRR